jgi:DNA-directed RNA polymerase II subunit RPB2
MARLRKLTYSCQLFVNITKRDFKVTRDGAETLVDTQEYERVPLGKVPVMLRSEVCRLFNKDNNSIMGLNECPQDQGGYFIINGSEKVILAQERRANNLVFVFKKTIGKFAYMAEVGSQVERGNKPPSTLYMKLWNRENNKKFGSSVVVTLPYVRKEIPIVIVFRALGIESERCSLLYWQTRDRQNYIARSVHQARGGDPGARAAPAHWNHRRIVHKEAVLLGIHLPSSTCVLARAPRPG